MLGGGVRQGSGATALLVTLLLGAGIAQGATGDLSAPACLSGDSATAAKCGQTTAASAGGANSGLDALQAVTFSPGAVGTDVYAVAQQDDAVVHLDRNPATGAVTLVGCITGETESGPAPSGSGACSAGPAMAPFPTSDTGLDSPSDIEVSPDGSDAYAISENDDAVMHFDRDDTTGALTFADCMTMETGTGTGLGGPCTAIAGATANGTNTGMDSPTGIAISPGGTSVYVTSRIGSSIARFTRAPVTGVLTYNGCIAADTDVVGCTATPTSSATGDATGFDDPYSPVVSADGDDVYVGSSSDAAVVWFDRAPNGSLTWNDCITGETGTGPTPGNGACSVAVPSATALIDGQNSGLNRAQSIAIPADGEDVYVGSQSDSAVYYFTRNASTGDLGISGCLTGAQQISVSNCSRIPSSKTFGEDSGLKAVQSVAISPDGKSLYAAAAGDDAIATFDRTLANGELDWDSCFSGEVSSGPTGTGSCAAPGATADGAGSGLDNVRSLAVSPDGLELVGGAEFDDALPFAARSNAPETSIDAGPPLVTNDPTAGFAFSADEAGASFQCRIDGGAFGACSGAGSHTTAPLADGLHTFQVRSRNDATPPGVDPTPASRSFLLDTVAPNASIDAGPSGAIAVPDAAFDFSASGGATGFECRLDGAAFAACASPQAYSGLADGSHTFEVRAEDAAGNVDPSPASRSFSVDTGVPGATITLAPKKTVRTSKEKKSAKFRFESAEPASFECKRDKGKDFKPCSSPYKKKYKRGKHTFTVRAVDAVGNVGPADSHTWKVKRKK